MLSAAHPACMPYLYLPYVNLVEIRSTSPSVQASGVELLAVMPQVFLVFGKSGWIGGLVGEILAQQGARFEYANARLEDRAGILAEIERVCCCSRLPLSCLCSDEAFIVLESLLFSWYEQLACLSLIRHSCTLQMPAYVKPALESGIVL